MNKEKRGRALFIIAALVLPLVFWSIFVLWPLVQAIGYAFTNWSAYSTEVQFIGFGNFARMFADPVFWDALRNTGVLAFFSPLLTLAIALFLATLLNTGSGSKVGAVRGVRGSNCYAVLFFIPQILSTAVIAVMFQAVVNPRSGLLNGLLELLGLDQLKRSWLADEQTALGVVLAVLVWSGVGFYLVIISAAMSAVPAELYESASLDGAGAWRQFVHVTVPSIRGTLIVCWIYAFMIALDSFTIVLLMTVGPGGPNNSTIVLGYYIYQLAFEQSDYGYASTIGVTLAAMVMAFALFARTIGREKEAKA